MIREMTEQDLEQVLAWRNSPEVRTCMYNKNMIDFEQHKNWYNKESKNPNRHLLIVEYNSEPFGFVNLNKVAHSNAVDWGFYVAPNSPKGRGKLLAELVFDFVFNHLLLHKICGQVIASNTQSIGFHTRQGFQQEGVLKEQYLDGSNYQDIILFGLLKSQWLLSKKEKA